jgi:hypothetical protein
MIFPWPARSERREAIAAAAAEKERSRKGAARASALQRDIQRMTEVNHFAEAIRATLAQDQRKGHG